MILSAWCRSLRAARRAASASSTRRRASRSSPGSCSRSAAGCSATLKMNFSIFVLGGLMIVIGATWTIMYNADLLLGGARARRSAGSARSRPCCGWRSRIRCGACFRTGVTLAMFTLVVFTLVVGATTTGSFVQRASTTSDAFGGGFDVRATTSPGEPDRRHARRRSPRARADAVRLPRRLEPVDAAGRRRARSDAAAAESYVVRGARRQRSSTTRPTASRRARRGYALDRSGLARRPRRARTSPSSTRSSSPRRGELELRRGAEVPPAPASTSRTRPSRPVARRRARPADRQAR